MISKSNRTMIKGLCEECNTTKMKLLPTPKAGNGISEYYSPETRFCGINELARITKKPIKEVKEFLNEQDVYTLHKPASEYHGKPKTPIWPRSRPSKNRAVIGAISGFFDK